MIDKKKTREIVGYTFQNQQENPELWYQNAVSFHEASVVIHENHQNISQTLRIFLFNAALSLELILKAILAAKGETIPSNHMLRDLCSEAKVALDKDQKCTLDLLTECFLWVSRYPAPTSDKKWDHYHDVIFEKHKIRTRSGNTYTTRADPNRFPSIENYKKIWKKCLDKYSSIMV